MVIQRYANYHTPLFLYLRDMFCFGGIMLRILICDDEHEAIMEYETRVKMLGEKHGIDLSIKSFKNAEQLFFYMEDDRAVVDLIYMDIKMPKIDGISAAAKLREDGYNGEIVFLTKQSEKAIRGYDVQAFHYIVKKESDEAEFERIFLSAVDQIQNKTTEYITFQGIGESRNVAIRDISYFSVNRRIITVHYGNEHFEFYSSMDKVEATMLEYGFLRVQRSYLVNTDYVRDFTAEAITMMDGTVITLSRKNSKQIREAIKGKKATT